MKNRREKEERTKKDGIRKDMGEERKGIEAQKADPPNPSQASMCTQGMQNGKQNKEKE